MREQAESLSTKQVPTPAPISSHVSIPQQQTGLSYLKAYARTRPEIAALWCFGLGLVVGWKLKPW